MKLNLITALLAAAFTTPALASESGQTIEVLVAPYIATLGSQAASTEAQLVEKAAEVCGSLENVALIANVTLETHSRRVSHINPSGTPGAPTGEAVLTLAYPQIRGTAEVFCRQ